MFSLPLEQYFFSLKCKALTGILLPKSGGSIRRVRLFIKSQISRVLKRISEKRGKVPIQKWALTDVEGNRWQRISDSAALRIERVNASPIASRSAAFTATNSFEIIATLINQPTERPSDRATKRMTCLAPIQATREATRTRTGTRTRYSVNPCTGRRKNTIGIFLTERERPCDRVWIPTAVS